MQVAWCGEIQILTLKINFSADPPLFELDRYHIAYFPFSSLGHLSSVLSHRSAPVFT